MEQTKEWKLKQKLIRMCDMMFTKKRADKAKDDVLYWLLRYPRLYVADGTSEFYLCTECGEKLPQTDFMSYISYVLSEDFDSTDQDLEAIRSEVEQFKRQHFENATTTLQEKKVGDNHF